MTALPTVSTCLTPKSAPRQSDSTFAVSGGSAWISFTTSSAEASLPAVNVNSRVATAGSVGSVSISRRINSVRGGWVGTETMGSSDGGAA